MEQPTSRTCPACGSDQYQFRSRKRIAGQDALTPEEIETNYRCKACEHEWRVRVPATRLPPP